MFKVSANVEGRRLPSFYLECPLDDVVHTAAEVIDGYGYMEFTVGEVLPNDLDFIRIGKMWEYDTVDARLRRIS